MNDKFQLWSPPKLDLSLDSFSDDLIQQFDSKRHQNVATPPEPNPEREVVETMIASPKKQQQDYLPHSPVSSSLPSEHDTTTQEEEEEKETKEEKEEEEAIEEDQEVNAAEEQVNNTELDAENNKEEEEKEEDEEKAVEEEKIEKASIRKSLSLSKKKPSVEEKPRDEVIAAVSSKVAPPDIKAVSVPEQPPATPKRRSFFSFRFC